MTEKCENRSGKCLSDTLLTEMRKKISIENDGSFAEELGEAKKCRNYGKIQPQGRKAELGSSL